MNNKSDNEKDGQSASMNAGRRQDAGKGGAKGNVTARRRIVVRAQPAGPRRLTQQPCEPDLTEGKRSIDLTGLLTKDVTESGSFDTRGMQTTSFDLLLQALPIPAMLINGAGIITVANEACRKIGADHEKIRGNLFVELFGGGEGADKVRSMVDDVFGSRKIRTDEVAICAGDVQLWARLTLRSVRLGDLRFVLVLAEDVTPQKKEIFLEQQLNAQLQQEIDRRKRVEQELRRSNKLAQALFHATNDMLALVGLQGGLLLANKAWVENFGTESTKIAGKTLFDFFPKDVAGSYMERLEEVQRTQTSTRFEEERDHLVFENEFYPVLEPDGKVARIAFFIRDITDRRRAKEALQRAHDELEDRLQERTAELLRNNERLTREVVERQATENALRASEQRFRALFESAEDWIFIKDAGLRYTHVNPAMLKFLELEPQEILGKTCEAVLEPGAAANEKQLESRVLQGQTIQQEYTFVWKGRSLFGQSIRTPLRNESGEIYGLCGIVRDITDRIDQDATQRGSDSAAERYPSRAMKDTLERLRLAAQTDSVVLLLGESGVGKDYFARFIHQHSQRSRGPFFSVNCPSVAPHVAESELFGHEAGSFTGAIRRKRGLLEQAEGGTLLLNEIGDLPLPIQGKLLAFLDTKAFTRVGGERTVTVNTRLIAATNRDLRKDVQTGAFRSDLFFRLNVMNVVIPPLRERMDDVPFLVDRLRRILAKSMGLSKEPRISSSALDVMMTYQWPGNVRELRSVLERALILSRGETVTAEHIGAIAAAGPETAGDSLSAMVSVTPRKGLKDAIDIARRQVVEAALNRTGGSVKEAAELLSVDRNAMNYLVRALGLERRETHEKPPVEKLNTLG